MPARFIDLRQALGLDAPGTPVRVIEPFQFLGEIKPDLVDALGLDVVPVAPPQNLFGFRNEGWRHWTFFDGTPLLVPEAFNTDPEPNGDLLIYPEGDRSVAPSGRMPERGFYFDAIVRQPPLDEFSLNPENNMEEFSLLSDDDLAHFKKQAERQFNDTNKAVLGNFGGTSFGDIATVPAMWLKNPKGIRDIAEWYISTLQRPDYIYRVFERQCEIGLLNLARAHAVVGDCVQIACISGTDFGGQMGLIVSPKTYRQLYKPFHKEINTWIHQHTSWKTFLHSCGSIVDLLPDFIDAGFDILNPVQTSAAGMDPKTLKQRFGAQIVFWGGGGIRSTRCRSVHPMRYAPRSESG